MLIEIAPGLDIEPLTDVALNRAAQSPSPGEASSGSREGLCLCVWFPHLDSFHVTFRPPPAVFEGEHHGPLPQHQ
jgi:hypothetical protein